MGVGGAVVRCGAADGAVPAAAKMWWGIVQDLWAWDH